MTETPPLKRPGRNIPVPGAFPPALIEAAEHVAEGRLAKAEPILRTYVKDNPGDVNGIRMLGEGGLSLGALRDAENLLARAVELAPDYAAARYGYANALYKRHRYGDALEQLEVLLQTDPHNPGWLTLKAANLVELNEHEAALPIFETIISRHPDYRQAYLSYGHARRAVGRVPEAIEAYERATSVYRPDRVIPMLPETISTHLASLQPAPGSLKREVEGCTRRAFS